MSTITFADTQNIVAFFEKPAESDGFHEIIDFLNANQIHYALTINPINYTSCIEQFWAKANTSYVVDRKRVIITESSIRSDLHLVDAGGIDCLPTATIFEELARMGAKSDAWNEFSRTMASTIICLAINQKFNFSKYIFDAMKKQSRRKQRKETEVPQDETHHDDSVPIPSNDPLLSGEDRMQLTELMILCTNLQKQVLDLEKAKDAQAKEIAGLKKRVQKLERKKKSRTTGLKRLRKVGESSRVESSEDKESLGAQEDASKQGRIKIVDETQGRLDDAEMFDTDDLHGDEVIVDMAVGEKQEKSAKINEREVSTGVEDSVAPTIPVTTANKGVTAAKIDAITPTSAPTTVIDELTLAQTLTTTTTTTTTTRPKARGVVVQEPIPLKRKDQVALDEEMARNLEAQLQAELIEEEKMARKKEE
ncbi:hypothetical protein Tco_0185504 [Tanacetum coccineum]